MAMRRFLSTGVLTVWGAVLVFFHLAGQLEKYLHPAFRPWVVASGVVLLLMAAGTLLLPREDSGDAEASGEEGTEGLTFQLATAPAGTLARNPHAAHDHACCGHDPGSKNGGIFQALVLTVPLLVVAVASPGQFGAVAVMNRGLVEATSQLPGYQPSAKPAVSSEGGASEPTETTPGSGYLPRNAAGQIKAQTVDLLYAAEEPVMREDFEGQEVEMIGQFMPAKANNPKGDRFHLVRMFVNCCASDAQPVAVAVETRDPFRPEEMAWVRVVGRATFPMEGGRRIPLVVAESITPSDPPAESLIY